jgi:acyl-CoA synthetase (AMP-forming)/AMP-acid ligase II
MQFNIADLIESVTDALPENRALIVGDEAWTYADLEAQANRFASFLRARGVEAGDHVGLHMYNGAPFVVAMLGTLKLRAVPININYRYVEHELRYLFDNADLSVLVYQQGLGDLVAGALDAIPQRKLVLACEDDSGAPLVDGAVPLSEALAAGNPARDFGARSGKDRYIIYTGGTTGMPRGVIWEQEDLIFAGLQGANPGDEPLASPEALGDLLRAGRDPLHIHPAAPLIHGSAQFASWISMFTGGAVGLVAGRSFDPVATCKLIAEHGMNVINLVGDAMAIPLADELARHSYGTDSVVAVASAGAILSDSTKEALERVLPNAMILNNFGASETGHQGTAVSGTGGRPRFYMHGENTAVLDEDLEPVAAGSGQIGMLARKGHVPVGYYGDEEKTARTFKVDRHGTRWVLPGDLATLEEDGCITLLGRGAVCINTGGEKVFPEEVEEALKAHEDVLDAVVVGVPDPRWGERVAAVVQLRPERSVAIDAVLGHCRERVAGYKVPRVVHLVEAIDRHPSGKPDYRWAKELVLARSTEPGSAEAEAEGPGEG